MNLNVRYPGLHRVNRWRADGSSVTHYYAWRGGPSLSSEYGTSAFDIEFQAAINRRDADAATKKASVFGDLTLNDLITAYMRSSDFTGLSPKSQSDYMRYIERIRVEYGSMPKAALEDPAARGDIVAWRDAIRERHKRTALYLWQVFRAILSYGVDELQCLSVNILLTARKGGRKKKPIYESERNEFVWTDDIVGSFMSSTEIDQQLKDVLRVGLWTGLRQADILKLRWSDYDGEYLNIRIGKRHDDIIVVSIPVNGTPVQAVIERNRVWQREFARRNMHRRHVPKCETIIATRSCRPYAISAIRGASGFRASWRKQLSVAGIEGTDDLHFHDSRGTAITNLATAGCTVLEIHEITGLSLKTIDKILRSHYLATDKRRAKNAMDKLVAFSAQKASETKNTA